MELEKFCKKYKISLNEQQKNAVLRINGKTLLLAVPGSGKTTVIITRIGYMVNSLKINPNNILTLTYSVAAARDMKERFFLKFGDNKFLQFMTIHSFCLKVIREYEKHKNTKSFEMIENSAKIIANLYYKLTNGYPSEVVIKDILTKISYVKNMMYGETKIQNVKTEKVKFYDIYKYYEKYKKENKLMDFDDQLTYAYIILKKYPEILSKFQSKFKYINIDEAQDTSKIQHEIIKLIVSENIFMVGDEDQSIYGFRAAYPKALLEFEKMYKDAKILFMETNYRSTKNIVDASNEFIKINKNRKDKNMISSKGKGKDIKNLRFKNIEKEYEYILEEIKEKRRKIAILYRNNDSSIPLIDIFEREKIRYFVRENETNFFSHKIVLDIKNFIYFAYDMRNFDAFKEIYYKINCGISKVILNKIKLIYEKNKRDEILEILLNMQEIPFWQIKKIKNIKECFKNLKRQNAYNGISYILNNLGYREFILDKDEETNQQFKIKINILYGIAQRCRTLIDFMKRIDKLEEIIKNGKRDNANIILSTIHASKGLEYDKVMIIDAIDGLFPSINKDNLNKENRQEEYEEEARLFYVAITRAKEELEILTYNMDYEEFCGQSIFVKRLFSKEKLLVERNDSLNV